MNIEAIKENLKLAQAIAEETYGVNPPPEIVAAVVNAITAQSINAKLEAMTGDLCQAAAVAAGH
jgi:hypothetical protein